MNLQIRKIVCVLLSLILIAGASYFSLYATAEIDEVTFAVATDIHIVTGKDELSVEHPESELYFQASGSGNIYDQALEITKSFLNDAADKNASFVLIPGDMTRNGYREEHEAIARVFDEFEEKTGIQVYVTPGNHDYYHTTPDEFKNYYKNAGFDNAVETDSKTASYTADVGGKYRLICVDSNKPGDDGDGIDSRLISWIEAQAAKAKEDGKEPVVMMHHSLLEHLYMGKLLMKDFVIRNSGKMAEKFCSLGIQYVFTGHEHGNDISKYVGKNGNVVYDILTTALSSYPIEYRMVTFSSNGVKITMNSIDECNMDALIGGYNDNQLKLLESDYNAFAYGLFRYSIEKKILKYVSPAFIKRKLKLDDSSPLTTSIDILFGTINEALTMPLYSENSEMSIESLALSKNVTLPKSEYKSLCDLITAMVAVHYYGNENMSSSESTESEILIKGLNTALEYLLTKCGNEGLNTLIGVISFSTRIDTDRLSPWFTAVKSGKEDSYKTAKAVLNPILDNFTHDFEPGDRDITLPAFGEKATTERPIVAFFKKLMNFFKYIFNIVIARFR
ncbi:MAG: metallophosphoesterase [Clostridiales bacterium]|nr:metallophosphoesterase [Clostridiales bacterium]